MSLKKYNFAQPQPTFNPASSYAGEWAGEYIAAALFAGVTLDNGGITVKPNIKYKQTISTCSFLLLFYSPRKPRRSPLAFLYLPRS